MDIVNILNENMAALVLNRPNSDGFFRIRCVHNNHYLQSDDLNKDGRLDLSEDNTGIASIFYFDALDGEGNEGKGSLVSYKEGYYFTQGRGTDGYSGIYVIREFRLNLRKTTWFPRHCKMRPLPAPASQE